MKKLYLAILGLLMTCSLNAQEISSTQKVAFYNSCMPSCLKEQNSSPDNASLMDIPFVFNAVCSCYCTRMAMRINSKQSSLLMRGSLDGSDPLANTEIKQLVEESAQKCFASLQ
jgi:hypothetical protein